MGEEEEKMSVLDGQATRPMVLADARRKENLLIALILGVGGCLMLAWVGLIGWGILWAVGVV